MTTVIGKIAPRYNDHEMERSWCREMAGRLSNYRRERSYSRPGTPPPSALDIDLRCYEIIRSIENHSSRTWGKILPAIIAERDVLSSTARRVLLRTMREAAKKLRRDAGQAEQRARRYDELIAQLDNPKQSARREREQIA
jgi:hypothetical protein